jgi:hypothetical protein
MVLIQYPYQVPKLVLIFFDVSFLADKLTGCAWLFHDSDVTNGDISGGNYCAGSIL